jgi:hypothetical protein
MTTGGFTVGVDIANELIAVQVFARPVTGGPVAVFNGDDIVAQQGVRVFNDDTGAGLLSLKPTASDLDQVIEDRIASVFMRGQRVWSMVLDPPTITTVSTNEDDFARQVTGVGLGGVLAEGTILPAGGDTYLPAPTNRLFAYQDQDYDVSGWDAANDFGPQSAGTFDVGSTVVPINWADPDAHFIGPASGTTTDAPAGIWWAAGTFVVPDDVGFIVIDACADNQAQIYLGGERVNFDNDGSGLPNTVRRVISVTPGSTQYLRCGVNNFVGDSPNPTFLIVSVWAWFGDEHRGDIITHTDADWMTLDIGQPFPSLNAGEAILHALADNQALGPLSDVNVSFDAVNDTAGNPWPALGEDFVTNPVNDSFLAFMKKLVSNGFAWYDVRMVDGVGIVLDAWVYGTGRTDQSLSLHAVTSRSNPLSGDILKLTYRGTRKIADTIIASYVDGFRYIADPSPTGVRKSVAVTLGSAITTSDVDMQGAQLVDIYKDPRTAIDLLPSANLKTADARYPFLGYDSGDTVLIPGVAGGEVRERVLSIGWSYPDSQRIDLVFSLGLHDLIAEGQDAVIAALTGTATQLSGGSVNGTAGNSAPVETATQRQHTPPPFRKNTYDFFNNDGIVAALSSESVEISGRLLIAVATLYGSTGEPTATGTDTTFEVDYTDGSFITSLVVPGTARSALVELGDARSLQGGLDSLIVKLVTPGTPTCSEPATITRAVVELYYG